jgi:hypothetical protein
VEDLAVTLLVAEAAAFVFFWSLGCYNLGRYIEQRRCQADLRILGRHLDRQIAEHREAVTRIPR